jgi:NAD(P)H-nitrite reductase large subunit
MSQLICHCFHVTEDDIRTAIREHKLTSIDEIRSHCLCSMGCGCCRDEVEEIARDELGDALILNPPKRIDPFADDYKFPS